MAMIKCPKCGKSYDNDSKFYENGIAVCPHCQNSPKKSKKKRIIIFAVLTTIILSFAIYKIFIVRTVDSGNGWKHQIGHFGTCEYSVCENEATHRLKATGNKQLYCDKHWESYGQGLFNSLADKNSSKKSNRETDAKVCAVKAVEDELKSPSTAKFCSYSDMNATDLGNDKWKVTGYVDAQNSFGATVRQNWTVTLTLTDSGFKDYSVSFS